MAIHLSGKGVNEHWDIHRSLEILQGLQNSAMLLIRELDEHIEQRDAGCGKHPYMIGNAVAAIVLTSYATEIALKTLHAQIKTTERPPQGHCLLELYDKLEPAIKLEAQELICTLEPMGSSDWLGKNPDIRTLIQQGNTNFMDWRYLPEKSRVTNGVPKVLVNVVQVIQHICTRLAIQALREEILNQ